MAPIITLVIVLGLLVDVVVHMRSRSQDSGRLSSTQLTCPSARSAGLESLASSSPGVAVQTGRSLFFDSRLSLDGSVSCASCHEPSRAFTDGRATSVGIFGRHGKRNSPTLYNVAYQPRFFWDGRALTLEQQVQIALTGPNEMGMTERALSMRFESFSPEVRRTLGKPTLASVSAAIAAFVRMLRSSGSRVDLYLYCGERNVLSQQERAGLRLFLGKANCVRCHTIEAADVSPLGGARAFFTDFRFHDIGAGDSFDPGLADYSHLSSDVGEFKTPTLRNVALTAPYMHDGSLRTLREVVEFYDRGGGKNGQVDQAIVPLYLTHSEEDELIAFLEALTSNSQGDELAKEHAKSRRRQQ